MEAITRKVNTQKHKYVTGQELNTQLGCDLHFTSSLAKLLPALFIILSICTTSNSDFGPLLIATNWQVLLSYIYTYLVIWGTHKAPYTCATSSEGWDRTLTKSTIDKDKDTFSSGSLENSIISSGNGSQRDQDRSRMKGVL